MDIFHQNSKDKNVGFFKLDGTSTSYISTKITRLGIIVGMDEKFKSLDRKLKSSPNKIYRTKVNINGENRELSIEKRKKGICSNFPHNYYFKISDLSS